MFARPLKSSGNIASGNQQFLFRGELVEGPQSASFHGNLPIRFFAKDPDQQNHQNSSPGYHEFS